MPGETYRPSSIRLWLGAGARRDLVMRSAAVALVGSLIAVLVLEMASSRVSALGIGVQPVADAVNVVATALFFGAGMLRYTRWKVTGEPYAAASAGALLVFAVTTFPMSLASRTIDASSLSSVSGGLTRVTAALVVAALLAPALGVVPADEWPRPQWIVGLGFVLALSVFATSLALGATHPALEASLKTAAGLDAVCGALWLTLAGLSLRTGLQGGRTSARWGALVMGLVGVAELDRVAAAENRSWSWVVLAAATTLVAGTVSIASAGAGAREALSSHDRELEDTTGALADSERLLAVVEARRTDLVHDARSMICALRAALAALDREDESAGSDGTLRLRAAMDVELERLGRLIEGTGSPGGASTALAVALAPLVATMRGQGLEVESRIEGVWVFGRSDDLAHIVRNLLVNAHAHAPGSPVVLRAESSASVVRVFVEDRGPGLPADLGDRVFDRGVGAGPGRGSGLGLDVARRLARSQGGDLTAGERPGGGARFVITLPSGAAPVLEAEAVGSHWD